MPHRRVRIATLARRLAWSRRRVRRMIRLHDLASRTSRSVAITPRLLAAILAERLVSNLVAQST